MIQRTNGRSLQQLRPITISKNPYGYADASILYQQGSTKILCSVTLQHGVPHFLKGSKTGWLSAEYALLPTATQTRTQRESNTQKINGRSVEISRLIGRSLRSMVDLAKLGEKTVVVDCDVLQADGGTRTAAITGAALALKEAEKRWISAGHIAGPVIIQDIAAISLGITDDTTVLVDIDYQEDVAINADYNFVMSREGTLVEVQGTTERGKVSWEAFMNLCNQAQDAIQQLFKVLDSLDVQHGAHQDSAPTKHDQAGDGKYPFFSLKNRLTQ